jgi:hypothetical protein
MRGTFPLQFAGPPMFLTAVLQAHTDSLPQAERPGATAPSQLEDTSVALERLTEALAVPVKDRVQLLPSAHRSRWV